MTASEPAYAELDFAAADLQSAVFSALSDPVRRAMVKRLALHGPMNVGELSSPFNVSAPAVSRHLKVLESARIVTRSVNRQWRVCGLEFASLAAAREWIDEVLPSDTTQ